MTLLTLDRAAVVAASRRVARAYAEAPALWLWRAFECAAYDRLPIEPPTLDLGCGDGTFFRLAWPDIHDVVGVDADVNAADAAVRSHVYRAVHVASAARLPFQPGSFRSAVANCSLEHMEQLDEALASLHGCLQPGAVLLASVITDKWREWNPLVELIRWVAGRETADELAREYAARQRHLHALTPAEWKERLGAGGFDVVEEVPIVPAVTARVFLLLDHVWHLRRDGLPGEPAVRLESFFHALPAAPDALIQVIEGLLAMERDWTTGAGLVLRATRRWPF